MSRRNNEILCSVYRGGTSRGIFIHKDHLPDDLETRNKIFTKLMGSPDGRLLH